MFPSEALGKGSVQLVSFPDPAFSMGAGSYGTPFVSKVL